jgi:hypothetical protein
MALKSKLKIESAGMFAAATFYAVVGIVFFALLVFDFSLVHIGIIGTLSLITAYGLFRKRSWAIWFVVILFLAATTVSAFTIYFMFGEDLILDISMAAYLVSTWIFTAYIAAKRKTLES